MSVLQLYDLKRIRDAIDTLRPHFDCVQIFCSKSVADNTIHMTDGYGNFFARYGQTKSFVNSVENGYIKDDTVNNQQSD